MENKAWLIYLETGLLLTRKAYNDWREIQKEYWDIYIANLAPMTAEELLEYFQWDLGEETKWPFTRREIQDFFARGSESLFLPV